MAFRVYSYFGACYCNLNNFDSANYFLLQSRKMLDRYPELLERENLFNTLGVLYYDNGNYIQSRNYSNEAIVRLCIEHLNTGRILFRLEIPNPLQKTALSLGCNIGFDVYHWIATDKI